MKKLPIICIAMALLQACGVNSFIMEQSSCRGDRQGYRKRGQGIRIREQQAAEGYSQG